ncbi:MAG: DUF4358 domain-containing protein [Lachnospiraceae bacterium]|nr:DUF4358 domain-containing protein [Lachnospiraceae bacterium]
MISVSPFLITAVLMTLALVLFFVLAAGKGVRDDVSVAELEEKLILKSNDPSNMNPAGAQKLKSLYGLTGIDSENFALYVPATNMDAQEFLLVRCSSAEEAESVAQAMRDRIRAQTAAFESYGVEQMVLIRGAVVDVQGLYCLYSSDLNSSAIRSEFRKLLRR